MILKRFYLKGLNVEKRTFRQTYKNGESNIGKATISGMTEESRELLSASNAPEWREKRLNNWKWLSESLEQKIRGAVLRPSCKTAVPYGLVLQYSCSERCQKIRDFLIDRDVYPAKLWPLDEPAVALPDSTRSLADRIFCVPCDMRYDKSDMKKVVKLLLEAERRVSPA
jgi:dTDP-4-amino-4,6-dideoxygalactose transaminase